MSRPRGQLVSFPDHTFTGGVRELDTGLCTCAGTQTGSGARLDQACHVIATMTSMEGWSRYFEDISHFLEGAERQYGIANESFTEYVLERLELCIRTCITLTEHLDSETVPNLDEGEVAIIEDYQSTLLGLIHCLRSLQQKWMECKGIIEATSHDFSYQAGIMERRGRGRPRFNIEREQLDNEFKCNCC